MIQRWALDISSYDYDIEHRPGEKIPQADYISRYSYQEQSGKEGSICFINPLPIDRNLLITETKNAYAPILSAFKNGWSITVKKRYPEFYAKR